MGKLCFVFSLTEREKKEREHKKTLLQLAKEHEKARELENVQRYHMPQDLGKGEKGKYLLSAYLAVNIVIAVLNRIKPHCF